MFGKNYFYLRYKSMKISSIQSFSYPNNKLQVSKCNLKTSAFNSQFNRDNSQHITSALRANIISFSSLSSKRITGRDIYNKVQNSVMNVSVEDVEAIYN